MLPKKVFTNKFHNKHVVKVIFGGIFALTLLAFPSYYLAEKYFSEKSSSLNAQSNSSILTLKNEDSAFRDIQYMELKIGELDEQKLDATAAGSILSVAKVDFVKGEYLKVRQRRDEIDQMSKLLIEGDAVRMASSSSRLKDLQKKSDDYKKLGVNVATVSAGITGVEKHLLVKEYDKADLLLVMLDSSLESLLFKKKELDKLAVLTNVSVPAMVAPVSNGGVTFERKSVTTEIGVFVADILTVDLNRVRAKTFTANDSDCKSDCPLKTLASFVSENGGIAGINGTYFCPADYPTCASTKNSFNTLVFDYKSKKYLNSDQNVYSVNPLISFYNDGAHYYTQALGFGRDISANGVISNFPTLVHGGGVTTHVSLDAKSSGVKTTRGGIGFKGKTLWAVMTRGATVPDTGYVFKALGAEYAMNLDGGGSSAMYFGGYKVGPGRNLPNAIVFTP
ncbi:MAG: phosphodiester glycosidase family protein [bacterium]|nr:phosphodiester glycosidase family protein [bacterium]